MNFQNSFDGNVLFPSPKNNSNSQIIKSTFQRNNIKHPSFIDRKIANLSSYQINKIFKRKKFMVFDGNRSIAHSIFHRTFDYLRKLPYFKMNTPRISLFDGISLIINLYFSSYYLPLKIKIRRKKNYYILIINNKNLFKVKKH